MIKMYIPTRGRWDTQLTKSWADKYFDVRLVVREDEYSEYKKIHPSKKIIILPEEHQTNIATIRDYILHTASGCFLMCDDILEVKPSIRSVPVDSTMEGFIRDIEKGFGERIVFGTVSTFTDGFTAKGTAPQLKPGNTMNVFCINKKKLPKEVKFNYGSNGISEDGYFNLSSALNGVRPYIFTQWRCKKKFWAPGGCRQLGRTGKWVDEAAATIYSLHPNFVRLKIVRHPSGEKSLYALFMLNKAYKWALQNGRKAD